LDAMHAHLTASLPLDEVRVCDHDDAARCECRKPAPGLLQAAAQDHELSMAASFMVGDRWRDIEAGRRAGCTTILVERGYDERPADRPDAVVASLSEAADWILRRRERTR